MIQEMRHDDSASLADGPQCRAGLAAARRGRVRRRRQTALHSPRRVVVMTDRSRRVPFKTPAAPAPEQIGEVLRAAYMEMATWVEAQITGPELCLSQWLALKFIADGRIRSIGDVTRALGISGGASTRLIDHLEERGLVARIRPNNDRRVVTLTLQSPGRRLVDGIRTRLERNWRDCLAFLPASQQVEILSTLTLLLQVLRASSNGRAKQPLAGQRSRDASLATADHLPKQKQAS